MTSVPETTSHGEPDVVSASDESKAEVEALRRQLIDERERSLHAVDARRGAEAIAAQFEAEVRELQYRLHVREAEVSQLQEVLAAAGIGQISDRPMGEANNGPQSLRAISRTLIAGVSSKAEGMPNRLRSLLANRPNGNPGDTGAAQ